MLFANRSPAYLIGSAFACVGDDWIAASVQWLCRSRSRAAAKVDSDLALTAHSNIQEANQKMTRQGMIVGGGHQDRQDNACVLETATALK